MTRQKRKARVRKHSLCALAFLSVGIGIVLKLLLLNSDSLSQEQFAVGADDLRDVLAVWNLLEAYAPVAVHVCGE